MALLAGLVGDEGVLVDLVRLGYGVLEHLLKAFDGTRLVAAVTVDLVVCALGPAVPGLLHSMARATEYGIVLGVAVDAVRAVHSGQHKYGNAEHCGSGQRRRQSQQPLTYEIECEAKYSHHRRERMQLQCRYPLVSLLSSVLTSRGRVDTIRPSILNLL